MEPEVEADIRRALETGELVRSGPTDAAAVFDVLDGTARQAKTVFRVIGTGAPRCVFLEPDRGNSCAVHRQLGPGRQAASCRLFPRVALSSPLGGSITLSHYCPTAANLLFDDETHLAIVEDSPAFPPGVDYEGLDATKSMGPLLRPGVLLGWEVHRLFEDRVVGVLQEEGPVEVALETISALAESLRRWTPRDGDFLPLARSVLARRTTPDASGSIASPEPFFATSSVEVGSFKAVGRWAWGAGPLHDGDRTSWHLAAESVPAHLVPEEPPAEGDDREAVDLIQEGWRGLAAPVRRWLAARAFASWLLVQGDGLRTFVLGLRVALGVLRAEARRGCHAARRPLDATLLSDAIRRSDLLLVHFIDPEHFARRLSRVER